MAVRALCRLTQTFTPRLVERMLTYRLVSEDTAMGLKKLANLAFNFLLICLFIWFLTFLWTHFQDFEGKASDNCKRKIENDFIESKVSIDRVAKLGNGYKVYTNTILLDGNELSIRCWMEGDGSFGYLMTGDDEH